MLWCHFHCQNLTARSRTNTCPWHYYRTSVPIEAVALRERIRKPPRLGTHCENSEVPESVVEHGPRCAVICRTKHATALQRRICMKTVRARNNATIEQHRTPPCERF